MLFVCCCYPQHAGEKKCYWSIFKISTSKVVDAVPKNASLISVNMKACSFGREGIPSLNHPIGGPRAGELSTCENDDGSEIPCRAVRW